MTLGLATTPCETSRRAFVCGYASLALPSGLRSGHESPCSRGGLGMLPQANPQTAQRLSMSHCLEVHWAVAEPS